MSNESQVLTGKLVLSSKFLIYYPLKKFKILHGKWKSGANRVLLSAYLPNSLVNESQVITGKLVLSSKFLISFLTKKYEFYLVNGSWVLTGKRVLSSKFLNYLPTKT